MADVISKVSQKASQALNVTEQETKQVGGEAVQLGVKALTNLKIAAGTALAAGLTFTAAMAVSDAAKETVNYYFPIKNREEIAIKWGFALIVVIILMLVLWMFAIDPTTVKQPFSMPIIEVNPSRQHFANVIGNHLNSKTK